jgi:hypothetical protein
LETTCEPQLHIGARHAGEGGVPAEEDDMMVLSYVLIVIGIITTVVGGVRFLIAAFEEGVWWGLGVLLFGIMTPIFLIFRFREAWPSTRTSLIGIALVAAGSFLQAWTGSA